MAKSVAFAVIFCAACAAQTPAAKASLEGHVVSVTGEPLKNATLRLQADRHPGPPAPPGQHPLPLPVYTTTSDAAGTFAFEAVDPAIYTLSAQRTGYLAQQYSTATGYYFTLAAGQPTAGVSVKMTPEARIEGKITNEDGEPFANTDVVVSVWGTSGNGLKQLIISGGDSIATTAADGTYVIGGLRAGHYFVSTTGQTYRPHIRYDDVPRERYVRTFYPAAPNAAEANAVAVGPGAVVRGIDIQLRKVTSYRVRGKVVTGAPDRPVTNLQIRMAPEDNLGFGPAGTTVRDDGTFEVNGAMPDTYILQALPLFSRPGDSTQPPPLFAYERIVVGKEDIEDLVLRLAPGVEVDGHFKIESDGQQPAPPATFPTANLIPAVSNTITVRAESSGNGAKFVFRNLRPDKYLPQILGTLPPGTYLKSIRFGAQDVTGRPIDLTSGTGGTLEIALSPHAAAVSGVLRNSDGDPLPQIPLTLWAQGFAPKSAVTDASGVFRFTNLPPGEYHVAAWDQLGWPPAIPEFLSQFENTAATVKLDEDSQQTIEVPVIKPDAIDAAMVNVR